MSKEFRWQETALRVSTAAALILSSWSVVPEPSKRAFEIFTSPDPNCSENFEVSQPYDLIAIFGLDSDANTSYEQKVALINTAVNLYIQGKSDKIVVIGDIRSYREQSIYRALRARVREVTQSQLNLPRLKVDFINHSVTFADGMDELSKLIKSHKLKNAVGISSIYYTKRLQLLSQNFGIDMQLLPAECFGAQDLIHQTADTEDIIFGERMGIVYSALDPHWNVPTKFAETIKGLKR